MPGTAADHVAPPAPGVDRDDWVRRQRLARERCDADGLWAAAVPALLAGDAAYDGMRVLAAGDGDGAVSVACAGRGARVSACDDSDALVARGRERCAAAAADVQWLRADPAALPFANASFDCALSAFAPMFCLDVREAVGELFRVVRPGGTVAFTAWTGGGIVGRLLRLAAEHDPPPRGIPRPLTWGREERLRQDLEVHGDQVSFEPGALALTFADRGEAVDRLIGALHPLAAVRGQKVLWAGVQECVDEIAGEQREPLTLHASYLVARAIRGSA